MTYDYSLVFPGDSVVEISIAAPLVTGEDLEIDGKVWLILSICNELKPQSFDRSISHDLTKRVIVTPR